ncbi:MAG: 4a-hydroxytetrahydrobiopterin dehydratase [Gemmataceae bacterium]
MAREKLPTYADAEIPTKLAEFGLDAWHLDDGWICRKFAVENWPAAMSLVNAIGYLAEAAWHHPDLTVTWGRVTVKLKTHSEDGITDRDFALARRIEDVILWKPLAESPFEPNPNKWIKG